MTEKNFYQMSRSELRTYLLEHRDNEEAFQAYMDKLASEPVLASGTLEDLEDPRRFIEVLEEIQKAKPDREL